MGWIILLIVLATLFAPVIVFICLFNYKEKERLRIEAEKKSKEYNWYKPEERHIDNMAAMVDWMNKH